MRKLLSPFQSRLFLLLVLANVALQLDITEVFFNRLLSTNTQTGTTLARTYPVCGTSQFWTKATPTSFVDQAAAPLSTSHLSSKSKTTATVSKLFLIALLPIISLQDFSEDSTSVIYCALHTGLSPPSKV